MPKRVTEDGEVVEYTVRETFPREAPFFKTPWNHDTRAESRACALSCKDPSKTQQQFMKDADINSIVAKFTETGELPTIGPAIYQDMKDFADLQDSIVTRHEVDLAWNKLSAQVRNTLKDPETFARYYEHCITSGDLEPLYELGLEQRPQAPPEPPKQPSPPGGVSPAPPAAAGAPSAPITAPSGA